jgi:GT2 family glycosyltransferase
VKRRALSHLAAIVRAQLIRFFNLLDIDIYVQNNPEVLEEGINPIWHYAKFGAYENRSGISVNSDNWNRLPDFIRRLMGNSIYRQLNEGRKIPIKNWFELLAGSNPRKETPSNFQVTVIVPVYNALLETLRCLDSLAKARTDVSHNVIVLDDCSPESGVSEQVKKSAESFGFRYLINPENYGFVKTVNIGMELANSHVILLNSDTVVSDYWLDAFALDYDLDTGAIVPLSNNATIYSTPSGAEISTTVDQSQKLAQAAWNLQLDSIEIPTGHGFCLFISKQALQSVGYFDYETFGQGYGEENDFSMRLLAAGYKIRLTPKTYVFHQGSASFGESVTERQKLAQQILETRWPNFMPSVRDFVESNAILRLGTLIRLGLFKDSNNGNIFFSHSLGGGVETAITASLGEEMLPVLIVRPAASSDAIKIEFVDEFGRESLDLAFSGRSQDLGSSLSILRPIKVTIHHEIGYKEFPKIISCFDCRIEYRLHDYYTICPFINLSDVEGKYCGEPVASGCNSCIASRDSKLNDIESWRIARSQTFVYVNELTAPSSDTANRLKKYLPVSSISVKENLPIPIDQRNVTPGATSETRTEARHLAIIGVLAIHKGLKLVLDLLESNSSKYKVTVIGYIPEHIEAERVRKLQARGLLNITGSYDSETEAAELLVAIRPSAILFPGRWPETYSYTLDLANNSNLPIIACNIGAIPDRIMKSSSSLLFNYDDRITSINSAIDNFLDEVQGSSL